MSFDDRSFRDALGLFATGVCLVTLVDEEERPTAITVNSFASVSLDPPLVLWSLQKDADDYERYAKAEHTVIAVLSEAQQEHSTGYAQKDNHLIDPDHFEPGENGAPLIKDALVNFECSLEQSMDGGDHTILLLRVTRIVDAAGGRPLLFFGGSYEQLA